MTSASLLIVLAVGTAVGALVGLGLGGVLGGLSLALLAGFLGTIIGAIVRNLILSSGAGLGPDDSKTPVLVIVYSAIASMAAGSAALEVARRSDLATSPIWIGTLAGLFSAILLSLLLITYHANPGEPPKLKSRRH
ncbi:MAG: hypothetical protein ACRECF_10760 [Methyloceanibacter sp.]